MKQNRVGVFKLSCLLTTASLAWAATAVAQNAASGQVEEIDVTATRVQRQGFTAPTPMTVLNKDQLQLGGTVSIGDALNYVPAQINNTSPQSTSTSTFGNAYFGNLRGLGRQRTLTLIDGERPVMTGTDFFNLNLIPLSMVQSIETVTGGASAAWGSDAVAGVMNVILDRKFEGLRANAQFGAPFDFGGGQSYKVDFTLGGRFGNNDRGHYLIGGEYRDDQAIGHQGTNYPQTFGFITNPTATATNGQPQQILVQHPYYSIASQGGLITSGPLAGTAFGPGGVPYQFQYGQYRTSSQMSGGDPQANVLYPSAAVASPIIEKSLMADFTYDVLDNVRLKANFLYGHSTTSDNGVPNYSLGKSVVPETIQSGNPFIPASIQAAMTANRLTTLAIGRFNSDFGLVNLHTEQGILQGTIGAEGSFGDKWSWDVYYSYGRSQYNEVFGPQVIQDLFQQSLDAVTSPTTGKPVCRITLTNPTSACQPVNIFGFGSPSQAALAYFEGTAFSQATTTQNNIAGTIRGEPFSTWAGPVSIAAGGEYRRLSYKELDDSLQNAGRFDFVNAPNLYGAYSVGEGFVESVIPLLSGVPLAEQLDFNGAFRLSEYNLAGQQRTWKLGIVDKVTSELMLRGTISQDLRAPNIGELFSARQLGIGNVFNPFTGVTTVASTLIGGNPNLTPEQAHTVTYGGSYTPEWLPGFRMSADWYNIDIHNEITSLSATKIVNFCYMGQTQLCANITPNPLTTPGGVITQVNSATLNLAKAETSGLDFEASHRLDMAWIDASLPGTLNSRLLVNYVDKFTTVTGIAAVQTAGVGIPRWSGSMSESYVLDQWKFDIRARYIGGTEVSNQTTNNYNHYPDTTYFDLGIEYAVTPDRQWVVYSNLTNVFDRQAPLGFNGSGYDLIGRRYNVGVRVNF